MEKLRNKLFFHHEIAVDEARRMRAAKIENQNDAKACQDIEIEWLTEFVKIELEVAKRGLQRWGEGDNAETESKLDSRFFLETYMRTKLKKEKKALDEAERALVDLRKALPDTWFSDPDFAEIGSGPKQEFLSALNTIRDEISLRGDFINRQGLSRNYGTNKTEIVRAVLPVLKEAGYSHRKISRMLAQAMAEAVEEVELSEKLVNSLAVSIGKIEKQRKEEGDTRKIPFLHP